MQTDLTALSEALKDIDPAKFPHGLEQYARFGPKTVRAILAVRELVMHTSGLEDSMFRIGITDSMARQETRDRAAGCLAFAELFASPDHQEARALEADVRLNFLWHFPGRCLNKGDYTQEAWSPEATLTVYVACFPAGNFVIPGKV